MRAVLQAISDELQRLRAEGESVVAVSEETLAGLRDLIARQRAPETAPSRASERTRAPAPEISPARIAREEPGEWTPPRMPASGPSTSPARPSGPGTASTPEANVFKLPPPPTVTLPSGDAEAQLAALAALLRVDPVARHYLRADQRAAIGVGRPKAQVLFIGDELTAGQDGGDGGAAPFVGAAAEALGKMIRAMGLEAGAVYVANLVPWRVPTDPSLSAGGAEKRAVSAAELGYALPYVRAAVEAIQPSLVVGLGLAAAQALLTARVTKLPDVRGRWHEMDGRPFIVTYHPAYVIQNGTNKSKRAVWEDLLQVMERAKLPISEKQQRYFLT
ncbi:MAG: hypothetical protein EAZ36_06450 [Verrucomicrobia bacterium]|nr:MAG: hypothetical protein EAZ36_06450 [Verrucomicrobiota bacterium]